MADSLSRDSGQPAISNLFGPQNCRTNKVFKPIANCSGYDYDFRVGHLENINNPLGNTDIIEQQGYEFKTYPELNYANHEVVNNTIFDFTSF
ncbi:hypothetical protein BCON_0017g00640 [Botryotinia convoluta]|uniref:Uncharacterized protein n=1 Tax=Botryotinia convoluta TaxID=54673 RepID=A0A4Z1IMN3_9HELO|nr:hypothetical protein BCON_0017g00640 [Botryotinia convoluta]